MRGKNIRNERKRVPGFPDIWLCQKLFGRRGNTPLLQRIKNRWTELREEEDKDRSSWHAWVRLVTWTILAFHSRYHTLGVIRFTDIHVPKTEMKGKETHKQHGDTHTHTDTHPHQLGKSHPVISKSWLLAISWDSMLQIAAALLP